MSDRRRFMAGDSVHHHPSGEDWLLATDEQNGRVMPAGWPATEASADDLKLKTPGTFEKRWEMLRTLATPHGSRGEYDPRRSRARYQLIDLVQDKPLLVYVAGPYTKGDRSENVRRAIAVAEEVERAGATPFVPHLFHFWDLMSQHPYQYWTRMDDVILGRCDALIRIPGESAGSDKEVRLALRLGLPVMLAAQECLRVDEWVWDVWHEKNAKALEGRE